MKRIGVWRLALLAHALAATSACRTVGADFSSEPVAELRLAETSADDVRSLFGEPYKRADHATPALRSEILYYRHAESSVEGGWGRVLAIELEGERVRGWLFDSSFESDSTDFDASARETLEVGRSTCDDALAALGTPSGRCTLPSNLAAQHVAEALPEGAVELWLWRYTTIDRHLVFLSSRARVLALAFDAAGVLLRIDYADGNG